MKVVLATDFIRHGGAERVLEQFHEIWPDAPIYTLLAEPHEAYTGWDIRSSWLQRFIPPRMYRMPFPLYPRIVDKLEIPADTDVLLSLSVSWMKSLQAPPGVPHLCYICRPMMFAYDRQDVFLSRYPAVLRPLLRRLAKRVADWDQRTAHRPDQYISISRYTAERVHEVYGIESDLIFPPVRTDRFEEAGRRCAPGDYFLTVTRLESYKRVDLIVEACNQLGLPLKVAGKGPQETALREMAGPTVEMLGFVGDEELPELVAGCRAFLFSAEEDFGISPVEAQAAGRPVVAYGAGGCLETVVHGETGLHFPEQSADSLMEALEQLQRCQFEPETIRNHAQKFSEASFRNQMRAAVEKLARDARGKSSGSAGLESTPPRTENPDFAGRPDPNKEASRR